jgi:hypothetical protein
MLQAFLLLSFCVSTAAATADDDWIPLFDGRTLNGWKASENPESFRVVDGVILADGPRAHLFYSGDVRNADFRNFELKAEVRTKPGANSGIYFHTRYQDKGFPVKGFEAQINNSALGEGEYRELKRSGSLYGIRSYYKAVARDDEWFPMHITVSGRSIQIRVNEILLVDYMEPENPVPDRSQPERRLSSGTFALQCHDPGSKVQFRNIRVKPLPDGAQGDMTPIRFDEVDAAVVRLQQANFPTIDFHAHIKGDLTLEQALAHARKTGINLGIAVNCGLGFPIDDDAGVDAYLKTMAGQPVFVGMQAEGREWINSEVEVPEPQAFMEMLVGKIVAILDNEPIDIYVNPTFLPEVIAAQYDSLWTEQRMQRVVDALVRNEIALEINSRYRIPSVGFLRRAKQAGVKFTLGTNNAAGDLGRNEYGLRMVQECGLTWRDMWMPRPDGRKPVQVRQQKAANP